MVYESDFYTTRRPYSRPTISSYTVTRYGPDNDWESPYSWPVRREFSRILHRPRPHVGIIYTERFLNSRPLTYFDDETKVIRARAGAILKQLHTPVVKPSTLRLPFQTLDTYTLHPRTTYGVPRHIYQQSFYNEPAHLTIGRGHLACVQYAGGKSYPRRKNLYSDENRNIRDEIKFRSYYNRSKHEDPNTLPTGFAWRLLHLPPKEVRPFKLYRHSRTLPHLDSSENKTDKNLCEDGEVQKPSHKKYQKRYTESLSDFDKTDRTKSYERSDSKSEPISRKKKIEDEASAPDENTSSDDHVTSLPTENEMQEEVLIEDAIAPTEEVAAPEKKKKKKKDEDTSDKPSLNKNYSRTKSIVQDEKPEDTSENTSYNRSLSRTQSVLMEDKAPSEHEPKEDIVEKEPISEPVVEEAKTESIFEKELTPEPVEAPIEDNKEEETLVEASQLNTHVEPEVEETKQEENEAFIDEPEVPEETVKESEMYRSEPEKESVVSEVIETEEENKTMDNSNVDQSLKASETKDEINLDTKVNEEELEIDTAAVKEIVSEEEPHNDASEELQEEELITQQEATENEAAVPNDTEEYDNDDQKEDSNVIVDFCETEDSSNKYQNKSDDEGIVSEKQTVEDSLTINSQIQDGTSEVSYTETSTTVYTREETVIHTGDLTMQDSDGLVITEELESSQQANNTDQATDEENVEIQE